MFLEVFPAGRPISEETYLDIGESPEHIELFDGSLFYAAPPGLRHQFVRGALGSALAEPAELLPPH